jgi:hypothetical protein
MMKKFTLLTALVFVVAASFAKAPRKPINIPSVQSAAALNTRHIDVKQESTQAVGDTLLWMPVLRRLMVNATDMATFAIHAYDQDMLANNAGTIATTSFGVYYGLPGASDIFDASQGDVDTGFAFLATSWFSAPATADNWLTFGPLTVPAAGANLRWKLLEFDNDFRDGYSVMINTAGPAPADFTGGTTLLTVPDNDPSTEGDTMMTQIAPVSISGATFGGQQIYIGFHHTANDQFIIGLDGFLLKEGSAVGINEINGLANISVYPNPSTGIINIRNAGVKEAYTVYIYNSVGQVVFTEKYNEFTNAKIDLGNQPTGFYNVRIENEKGSMTKSIMVSNK